MTYRVQVERNGARSIFDLHHDLYDFALSEAHHIIATRNNVDRAYLISPEHVYNLIYANGDFIL